MTKYTFTKGTKSIKYINKSQGNTFAKCTKVKQIHDLLISMAVDEVGIQVVTLDSNQTARK